MARRRNYLAVATLMGWFIMHASNPANANAPSTFEPDLPASTSSWLSAMTEGHWGTIASAGSRIADVLPSPLWPGRADGITDAWNGGTVDQSQQSFLISLAGGHGDGAGNEIYRLLLDADAPAWERIRTPSDPTGGTQGYNTIANYGDGQPRSAHTYSRPAAGNGYVYHLGIDAMYSGATNSAASYRAPVSASSGVAWEYLGNPVADAFASGKEWLGGGGCFDPTTGHVWATGQNGEGNRFVRYDPAGDAFKLFNVPSSNVGYNWLAVADELRLLIVGGLNGMWYFDLDSEINEATDTITWHSVTQSGSPSVAGQGKCAHYHHPSRALFSWHSDGANLRKCAIPVTLADTWVHSSVSPLSGNTVTPSSAEPNGTFGRFNIVKNLGGVDAFVLLNGHDEDTYVFRIPSAGL